VHIAEWVEAMKPPMDITRVMDPALAGCPIGSGCKRAAPRGNL